MNKKIIDIVFENAVQDTAYDPYCLRCSTMDRMKKLMPFYWQCKHCGAQHDLREVAKEAGLLTEIKS